MKKVTKTDWLEEGLRLLATEGYAKITIENMCKSLSVTKGSFYHHFKNIDEYIKSLMEYWLKENTIALIETTENFTEPDEKHIRLNELTSAISQKAEQVIRAWGFSNDTVRLHVQLVDNMRMEYLTRLNIQTGMDEKDAQDYALIEYSTLIGIQQLRPDITKEEFKHLYLIFSNKN